MQIFGNIAAMFCVFSEHPVEVSYIFGPTVQQYYSPAFVSVRMAFEVKRIRVST